MSASLGPVRYQRFAICLTASTIALSLLGCSSNDAGQNSKTSRPNQSPAALRSAQEDQEVRAGTVQVVKIQANDSLRFTPATLVVRPGRVRLIFTVTGRQPQTFSSRALNADSGNVLAGHTATIDLVAPAPGKYAFYSAYHRKQGMVGKMLVRN